MCVALFWRHVTRHARADALDFGLSTLGFADMSIVHLIWIAYIHPSGTMASSSGYDFSQIYHSSTLAFSPGTTFLASSHHNRLIVRSSATLAIVRTWLCRAASSPPASSSSSSTSRKSDSKEEFEIDTLLWSADSLYLLAFSSEARTAWVFGLAEDGSGDSGEIARIGGEGVEGLVRVEWSSTGRDVLAWSDFGVSEACDDLLVINMFDR